MLEACLLLGSGFLLLLGGAEVLVRNAVRLSSRYGLRPIIIGVTVVAFGTSAPEFLVSFFAAAKGHPGIVVGNVAGSNVANLALVLGTSAVISTVPIDSRTLRIEYLATLMATLLAVGLAIDGSFSRIDGAVLCAGFVAFMVLYVRNALRGGLQREGSGTVEAMVGEAKKRPLALLWLLVLAGLGMVLLGSDLLVDGAVGLARLVGAPEGLIAATVVAVGTSLPELATSVIAAAKKEDEIAVGNVLGSNVFNLLFVLGPTAAVAPIPISPEEGRLLLPAMLIVTLVLFPMIRRHHRLQRAEGVFLLTLYLAFLALSLRQAGIWPW